MSSSNSSRPRGKFFRSRPAVRRPALLGDEALPENAAKLVLIYGGRPLPFDDVVGQRVSAVEGTHRCLYKATRIPVYGDSVTFRDNAGWPVDEEFRESAIYSRYSPEQTCHPHWVQPLRRGSDVAHSRPAGN